jgi:glycosyltransferase involved in cell wall biosynthesis
VITTETGGIGEAVGDHALIVDVEDPAGIAAALDEALSLPEHEREALELRARDHALQFDRGRVFDLLMARLSGASRSVGALTAG